MTLSHYAYSYIIAHLLPPSPTLVSTSFFHLFTSGDSPSYKMLTVNRSSEFRFGPLFRSFCETNVPITFTPFQYDSTHGFGKIFIIIKETVIIYLKFIALAEKLIKQNRLIGFILHRVYFNGPVGL